MAAPPKAFISYSHDSTEHKAWVLKLASDLVGMGIDVVLDQWGLVPGQDVSLFMQNGITQADRVIMVCSGEYVRKAEDGVGGVGYERLIVTAEVVQSIDTVKFIPVIRSNNSQRVVPSFLGPRLYVDFRVDQDYQDKLIELARQIHGAPAISKPPIGPNPFSGTPPSAPASAQVPAVTDEKLLDSKWFEQEHKTAMGGLGKLKISGCMELRFALLPPISKSQIELLNAVRQSEIKTFGWPIGILIETEAKYKPRPYGDGIRAEISVGGKPDDRLSYDYWALRSNGDFYLLQSLFEDTRTKGVLFFDTRIVRVTESLMFAQNLYSKLGAPPESRVRIRVTHVGLKGRKVASASPNRLIFEQPASSENISTTEFVTVLDSMKETRVEDVRRIVEPLLMLFDFMELQAGVYEEIVRSFERGVVR